MLSAIGSFIFSRFGAYALIAALIGYSYYLAYDAGKDAKAEWAADKIAAAQKKFDKEKNSLEGKVAKLEKEKQDWLDRADKAVALAKIEQAALVLDLEQQLRAAQNQKAAVKVVTKEVIRYVSPQADAACTITAGFVWVHDLPLNPGLAGSPPGNVDAPAGIAASEVARIDAENLAECVERGEVINAWQRWYAENKGIFERVKKESAREVPRSPSADRSGGRRVLPDPEPAEVDAHPGGLVYGLW